MSPKFFQITACAIEDGLSTDVFTLRTAINTCLEGSAFLQERHQVQGARPTRLTDTETETETKKAIRPQSTGSRKTRNKERRNVQIDPTADDNEASVKELHGYHRASYRCNGLEVRYTDTTDATGRPAEITQFFHTVSTTASLGASEAPRLAVVDTREPAL